MCVLYIYPYMDGREKQEKREKREKTGTRDAQLSDKCGEHFTILRSVFLPAGDMLNVL